jgi:hypothetical protein
MERQTKPTISPREYFQWIERHSHWLKEQLIVEPVKKIKEKDPLSKFLNDYQKKLKQNNESNFSKDQTIDFSSLLDK